MPALVVDQLAPNGGLTHVTYRTSDPSSHVLGPSHTSHQLSGSLAINGVTFADKGGLTASTGSAESKLSASEAQQLAELNALNSQLQKEIHIKEGAERLLQMQLNDGLRVQVESELEMARKKIDDITKKIEIHNNTLRPRKRNETFRNKFSGASLQYLQRPKEGIESHDDSRTALQLAQAESYITILRSVGRSVATSPTHGSSSASTAPSETENCKSRIETMNQLIGILKRNMRVRYDLGIPKVIEAILPALGDRSSKQCRATAYRLIRHLLVKPESVVVLRQQELDWYIVKALSRDNKYVVEKEQVIKLIRAMIEIGSEKRASNSGIASGKVPLSEPIMRAFIAVAEQPEDPFRPICIQTLAEILLIDIELVARTDGIRVLLHALAEGPLEMAPLLSSAFLYIADSPRTRAYLHPGTDLEMALSGVTDAYGKGADYAQRMKGVVKIIISMLRTWSGLMYYCIHDKLALRALVDGLRIPSLETREVILDMFFDLFNITPPEWHQAFIAGRRLTMIRRSKEANDLTLKPPEPLPRPQETLKLTDQYIALLMLVFTSAGLMDALTCMLEETAAGSNLSRKATLLMAELLQIGNRVLPLSIASKVQALPRIFNLASDYGFGEHRIIGTSALSAIDSYNRHRARLQPAVIRDISRPRANSVEDAVRRRERQVEQTRIKIGMQMDDKAFQAILLETQVMLTKEYAKWNFDALQDLVEGPLLSAKRMEEAIKVSRFVKKLISFYHPFSHRFSDMQKNKPNHRWVKLGCSLLSALLLSSDGLKFLGEDEFLGQIVKSFAQLDPFNGTTTTDPIFSKTRMEETLTYGYFEMLGTLSKRKEGIDLMEKFKLFTAFYHLSELRSREDLIKGIIENLDYSIDGHSRIVLSKALTSSYRHIRVHATNHLGELIQAGQPANSWTLRLLLTQLYDPAVEVQEVAVRYLEEACESPDVLQIVVEMHPTLDHLGEIGHPLLLKFMSTTLGFRYLYAADYIDREMDIWFHERNLHYVVHIEVFISKAFNFTPSHEDEEFLTLDGIVPPHFYGVMAKTDLGCQVLQEKGHFGEFAAFIRRHGLESDDQEVIQKLKSVLWAVGNIGAAERGLPFLEEEEIVPAILEIAERSLVFSVRGTCFFVLGLISSTPQGAEILDDYRWEATLSPLGLPTGLCVPLDVDKFISVPSWETVPEIDVGHTRLKSPSTDEGTEVMTAIYNLANTVIAGTASRSLGRMKTRSEYKEVFSSTSMFYRALHTISSQRYRLPVRRYIIDLFNIELDADVMKTLSECGKALKMTPSEESLADPPPPPRVVSMLPSRNRRISDSDEESVLDDDDKPGKHPVLNLRPMSRIFGFEAEGEGFED
ncbi:hypothetical protein NLI96_g8977 [Meripilus lineatus]|uniref:REM-1 domain-containing protein n=1 Tax=Meripilus lineatus TaxID=2056292 RepID=A0AAD5UWB4_9APHY|nr:hypothetical protein NLI96_g8977 [Physisporinus lineatus]